MIEAKGSDPHRAVLDHVPWCEDPPVAEEMTSDGELQSSRRACMDTRLRPS